MPVQFACSCGRQLRVGDEYAGRRIKCPECGEALTAPAASRASSKGPTTQAPPADTITFSCDCGQTLRVSARLAGRSARCPNCDESVPVPAPGKKAQREEGTIQKDRPDARQDSGRLRNPAPRRRDPDEEDEDRPRRRPDPDDEDEDRPARRRRDEDEDGIQESPRRRSPAAEVDRPRRRHEDDDEERSVRRDRDREEEEEEEERRPKKRSRKQQKSLLLPLLLFGGLGLLLLGGGAGVAVWLIFFRADNASDMAFVPPDAQGFMTVRIADTWKLESTQKAMNQMKAQMGGFDPFGQMQTLTGLTPSEVERVSIVLQDFDQKSWWVVVQTVKPYDRQAILGKFSSSREAKHEGKSYHVGQLGSAGGPRPMGAMGFPGGALSLSDAAVHLAGSRVLVYSDDNGMKRCLTAAARKKPTGPLAGAIQKAGQKHGAVVGFNLPPAAQQQMKNFAQMIPKDAAGVIPLLEFTGGTMVQDNVDDKVTTTEITLTYPDADRAGKARKAFDGLKALAELFMPKIEDQFKMTMPPDQADKAIKAFKTVLDGITSEVSGNDVKIRMKVDNKVWEGITFPGAGMPVPGGGMPNPPGGFAPNPPRGNNPGPGNPPRPGNPGRPGRGVGKGAPPKL
jgi:hypothetical protein